ncbi:MAG: phosphatase PAP2 family protein, partial [Anaerovibrio sp.]|uniref:phosphatase PAP2 family protein n=1 Tax=Anaerovibrio sp. TaxID=1872532 RepID=UPI0025CBF747
IMDWIVNCDHMIIFAVQHNIVAEWLTPFMRVISFVGEYAFMWIVVGSVLCCSKKYRRTGIAVLLGVAFTHLVGNELIKHIVMRQRPCFDFAGVSVLPVLPPVDSFSFPSGHTFSSFAAATALLSAGNKKWSLLGFAIAFIMGFSRIYLFVHYPSDVMTGMVLGILFGLIAWKLAFSLKKNNVTDSEYS